MKEFINKMGFRLASWLYQYGIIAPELLEHKKYRIMNDEEMEDIKKSLKFWGELSMDMKMEYLGYMKKYNVFDVTPDNITDEQLVELWMYAV